MGMAGCCFSRTTRPGRCSSRSVTCGPSASCRSRSSDWGTARSAALLPACRTLSGVRRPWCTRRRSAARRRRVASLPGGGVGAGEKAEAVVQLAGREVEGGVEVGRAGLGADDRTLAAERDLHALAVVGLAGVLLVEELHVDAQDLQLAVEPVERGEFVPDVLSKMLGDFDVAATDHDLHETSRWAGCDRFDASR